MNHLELTIAAAHQPTRTDAPAVHGPLPLSTAKYALKAQPDLFIGYKTGEIKYVKDVSLWVNSENQDMLMDRFLGKSISANIRHLGSIRDKEGNVTEDTIEEALRTAVGRRVRVEIGTVLETESGALRTTHGVRRIFHVATVKGIGFGEGVQARKPDLAPCVTNVLTRADASNQTLWRRFWKMESRDSILLPLLGAGDGGLGVEEVAEMVIPAAVKYLQNNPLTSIKEIYFIAFRSADRDACEQALEPFRRNGILS